MKEILILYSSGHGNTRAMAQQVARGVESVTHSTAVMRTVPTVSADTQSVKAAVPDAGAPYATLADLSQCDGLVMGSPTHFGNMSASLKHFLDQTSSMWFSGKLVNKPAAVFTSTGSMHGGQESTLLSMQIPLLHHGMVIVGIPYFDTQLMSTTSGGSPYGATHYAQADGKRAIDKDERALCSILGKRVAELAHKLSQE